MFLPIFVVDAFITDPPFTGNPAAVCVLPLGECDAADIESRLQGIAAGMNLSETAFVAPLEKGDRPNRWALRWFTPNAEVELCGHATLAAAYALRERGLDGRETGRGANTAESARRIENPINMDRHQARLSSNLLRECSTIKKSLFDLP
ncbi:MAG: PhzF family phenazine biosynthesis protein [Phycisphaerales bacterium]|nr:PhzF family phenazine biosynthesis protein [Phycisphaerales bacterium]